MSKVVFRTRNRREAEEVADRVVGISGEAPRVSEVGVWYEVELAPPLAPEDVGQVFRSRNPRR